MLVKRSIISLLIDKLTLRGQDRLIAKDMALVMSFALLAKFLGAAKEIVVAWRYGVSEIVDVYLYVFNILSVPVGLWYSVLTAILIPLLSNLRNDNSSELSLFRSELNGFTLLVAVSIGLTFFAIMPVFLQSTLSGLTRNQVVNATHASVLMSAIIPFGIMAHLGSVHMMSDRRHANTFLEGIPALFIMLSVLVYKSMTIFPLVWGTVIGFLCQAIITLKLYAKFWRNLIPRFTFRSSAWKYFFCSLGALIVGQFLLSITSIVDQFFAVDIGPGSISALGYSNRILSLILTLCATAVARAALPVFSSGQYAGSLLLASVVRRWSLAMFGMGFLIVLIIWPLSTLIVGMLFERGAFLAADTQKVAAIFRYSLLQIPFYLCVLVLSQAMFTVGRYKQMAINSAIVLCVKVLGNYAFIGVFGLVGLVLATAAMYAASAFLLYIKFSKLKA